MRITLTTCLTIFFIGGLLCTNATAKKYPRRKVRGQYTFSGSGFQGTLILAKDRAATYVFDGGNPTQAVRRHPEVVLPETFKRTSRSMAVTEPESVSMAAHRNTPQKDLQPQSLSPDTRQENENRFPASAEPSLTLASPQSEHPDAGRWKLKRRKQLVFIDWPVTTSSFEGVVLDLNTITGCFRSTKWTDGDTVPVTFSRISLESNVVHHMLITKTKTKKAKGVVFYDYRRHKRKDKRRDFCIVVYARPSASDPATLQKKRRRTKLKLRRLGFWKMRLTQGYGLVEAYVIKKDYFDSIPQQTAQYPALTVDGDNVRALDIRGPDFKWGIPK